MMRLFIAINFSQSFKEKIAAAAKPLIQNCKGRFTPFENLHLTVVFLGEKDNKDVTVIKDIMNSLTPEKMLITICGAGVFDTRRGNILYLDVVNTIQLNTLYNNIVKKLNEKGILSENKKYTPHITIARETHIDKGFGINEFNKNFKAVEYVASSFELMLSERINGNMKYTPLHSVNLQ